MRRLLVNWWAIACLGCFILGVVVGMVRPLKK
jgi:acyl-CoA synthetase (AMP-forming)/AMP-acid ligase II